jgi:hypothetical protein
VEVEQKFIIPLKVCANRKKKEAIAIPVRIWSIDEKESAFDFVDRMGEMGLRQIEEVWKHYKDIIWVSNYGYVAKFTLAEAKDVFGDILEEQDGYFFRIKKAYFTKPDWRKKKDFLRERNFVPDNRSGKYQICLHVDVGQVREDLHRIVAKTFLENPEHKENVYHIDNNSYNNSVTNLIWLTKEEQMHCL